jgi:hypothetical protein
LAATLPLAATLEVVEVIVLGENPTVTDPPTIFGLFTPSALGTTTKPTAIAQIAQAPISFFMSLPAPFLAWRFLYPL